jgi:hypothetical protein
LILQILPIGLQFSPSNNFAAQRTALRGLADRVEADWVCQFYAGSRKLACGGIGPKARSVLALVGRVLTI